MIRVPIVRLAEILQTLIGIDGYEFSQFFVSRPAFSTRDEVVWDSQTIYSVEQAPSLVQAEASEEDDPSPISLSGVELEINVRTVLENAAQRKAVHETFNEFVEESIFVLYLNGAGCHQHRFASSKKLTLRDNRELRYELTKWSKHF